MKDVCSIRTIKNVIMKFTHNPLKMRRYGGLRMTVKDLINKLLDLDLNLEVIDSNNDFIEEVSIVNINEKEYVELS